MKKVKSNQQIRPGSEKAADFETFLEKLNEHLSSFEQEWYEDLPETLPSVHVIGVPRSGTTLLTQLISSGLDVGYINNFIARFWKAPVTGIRISREILGDNFESTLTSKFGKTCRIREPHEFNYFWSDVLGYDGFLEKTAEEAEQIDWKRISIVVRNMIGAFNKPLVFKSFLPAWHAARMQTHLPRSCFVWIRREPLENALSLLETRKKIHNSEEEWISLKPLEYKQLKYKTPSEQVAGQVYYLEQAYQKQIDQLPESNYLILEYKDVCENPIESLKAIEQMINRNGGKIQLKQTSSFHLKVSKRDSGNSVDYEKVREALSSYYS